MKEEKFTETQMELAMVHRAQRGDNEAFEFLVTKYQPRTFGIVASYIGNPTDAQDIVQDVFFKVFRNLDNFRNDCTFSTWLHRITINTMKTYFAKQARERQVIEMEESVIERQLDLVRGRDYTAPLEHVVQQELSFVVNAAIQRLPEKLRSALTLHEIEGMSYKEIAVIMECPLGTVRSRISRAKIMLTRILNKKLDDFRDD